MNSFRLSKYSRKIIFVILGAVGLYLYLNLSAPIKMNLTRIPYDFLNAIILLMFGRPKEISQDILALLLDGILCLGGLFLWAAFFAQFVLPVRTLKERLDIPSLVFNPLGQEKGPAIFIENGKIKERLDETERSGKGVILLDTASAAVLQAGGNFSRAVGPGLVFTRRNERITKAIDLHVQERIIGPREGELIFFDEEEDPLTEKPEEQYAREAHRMQTSGLTRDGIEVVPNISTTFRLKADKDIKEGETFFGYDPKSVEYAVLHEGIAPAYGNEEPKKIPWDWLPAHLAADLWREYLRKFLLNQLFDIKEVKENGENNLKTEDFDKTDLNRIIDMIYKRLTRVKVQAMDEVGEFISGKTIESKEYKLLEKHGITVLVVKIDNLQIKNEKKLIDRWKATWLQQAIIQQMNTEKMKEQWRQVGKDEGLMEFSSTLINPLYREIGSPRNMSPNFSDTLQELLRGTRTSIVRDPTFNISLAEERETLDFIIEWVMKNQNGPEQKSS
jgi:hypothetical protein